MPLLSVFSYIFLNTCIVCSRINFHYISEYSYSRGSRACHTGSAVHFAYHADPSISTKKVNLCSICMVIHCSNWYLMKTFCICVWIVMHFKYEWMFLILFDIIYLRYFLQNRTIIFAVRQAFARFCHGFFQVWGKCCSKQFPTQKVYQCWYTLMILFGYIDILLFILADVMPFNVWISLLLSRYVWKMLYHTWQMLLPYVRWYYHTCC